MRNFLRSRAPKSTARVVDGQRTILRLGEQRGHTHALCSLATGPFIEFLETAAPTFERYAQVQGYDLVLSAEPLDPGRPASWSKLALVSSLLDTYEVVIWLDADTVVVRYDSAFPEPEGLQVMSMVPHPQERNEAMTVPNAGVFCLRNSDDTRRFLAEWTSAPTELYQHNWWENAALLKMFGYSLEPPYPIVGESAWRDRVRWLDLRWNSVPGYCSAPDPVVVHHARADHGDDRRRIQGMRADARRALRRS